MCSHKSCKHDERIWLPINLSDKSEANLHHWCIHCGLVKNISDDKPKKIGHWMNILSKISYHESFKQCQKRLIAKELQSCEEFVDLYGITGSAQRDLFIEILKKYCKINPKNIDSFIC
jgi:hypothetical protein